MTFKIGKTSAGNIAVLDQNGVKSCLLRPGSPEQEFKSQGAEFPEWILTNEVEAEGAESAALAWMNDIPRRLAEGFKSELCAVREVLAALDSDIRATGTTPAKIHAAANKARALAARVKAREDRARDKRAARLILLAARCARKAPKHPVSGRGFKRVELPGGEKIFNIICHQAGQHVALVSERIVVNSFGRIGYPKKAFCSPELAARLESFTH